MHDDVYGRNRGKRTFVHESRNAHKCFKIVIRKTMPDFRPFENANNYVDPGDPKDVESSDVDEVDKKRISLVGPPMDLLYVRQVIKE